MDERLIRIADHYGLESQLDMLQEECAELIQAISKYKRNGSSGIVEEMADVFILLDQVIYLLNKQAAAIDVEDFIVLWMEKKIRRQLERIEKRRMTNKEAIKYLITPVATSTEPSAEYLKQKEAYVLAIKALDLVSRLDGFKYVTTEVLLRENEDAHFDIYKRGWNDAIQATIDASDRPVTDIIKAIKENEVKQNE